MRKRPQLYLNLLTNKIPPEYVEGTNLNHKRGIRDYGIPAHEFSGHDLLPEFKAGYAPRR